MNALMVYLLMPQIRQHLQRHMLQKKMELPTNPYDSVMTLCNKDLFRSFLKDNGFNAPVARGYSDNNVDTSLFSLPVIIKPVDSSGSKGATVIHSWNNLNEAIEFCFFLFHDLIELLVRK